MRTFDLCRDMRVGDRPQRRHRLDRGEGQVIAGNRLGVRTRQFGDGRGDLAGIDRVAAMLCSEDLPRDLGADPRPIGRRDGVISQPPCRPVPCRDPPRHLDPEGTDIAAVNLERRAQPDG